MDPSKSCSPRPNQIPTEDSSSLRPRRQRRSPHSSSSSTAPPSPQSPPSRRRPNAMPRRGWSIGIIGNVPWIPWRFASIVIASAFRSGGGDGRLSLSRLTVLFVVQCLVHCCCCFGQSPPPTPTTLWWMRHASLVLSTLIFSLLVAGYSTLFTWYRHSIQVIFNRNAPPPLFSTTFWTSFGEFLHLVRPLSILWRRFTSRWRVLPDVIVLGEVRCGTTTLCQHLSSIDGCHAPFCPWAHPELDRKETFYFVGHYFEGSVDPCHYGMCFPLKVTCWWFEHMSSLLPWRSRRRGQPTRPRSFFTFDGCAQYLSSPTAPHLIAEAYRMQKLDPPVLVACVRNPIDQACSWWNYENAAMEWGDSMGLAGEEDGAVGCWNADLRSESYPPRTMQDALDYSDSAFVTEAYESAARLVAGGSRLSSGGNDTARSNIRKGTTAEDEAATTTTTITKVTKKLPPWSITWPGGQLGAIGRNGRYASNIRRYERVFDRAFPSSATTTAAAAADSDDASATSNKLKHVTVIPIERLSDGDRLQSTLKDIMDKVYDRRQRQRWLRGSSSSSWSTEPPNTSSSSRSPYDASIDKIRVGLRRNAGRGGDGTGEDNDGNKHKADGRAWKAPTEEDRIILAKRFIPDVAELEDLCGMKFGWKVK